MKKLFMSLLSIMLVFCLTGMASATSHTFQDKNDTNYWVDSYNPYPAYWVYLSFPDSTTSGTYSNGVFEYDDHVDYLDYFTITLGGWGDNSNEPIDFFLDFDSNHNDYLSVASKNVANYSPFTLALDIKNNRLLYNGAYEADLTNVNQQSFIGYDGFYAGYGCHFWHDYTEVDVGVNPPVPEPGTMLLLCTGLIGVAGFQRKFRS